jgi:hypothetical protein
MIEFLAETLPIDMSYSHWKVLSSDYETYLWTIFQLEIRQETIEKTNQNRFFLLLTKADRMVIVLREKRFDSWEVPSLVQSTLHSTLCMNKEHQGAGKMLYFYLLSI